MQTGHWMRKVTGRFLFQASSTDQATNTLGQHIAYGPSIIKNVGLKERKKEKKT